ncbi:hypothetical protein LTR86_011067 [Recurvomyces mirabilis]|nr:hypothetical protein LTR86_011067 [Recurvomyces mirabilis]
MLYEESAARRSYNMSVRIASAHNVLNLKKPLTITVQIYFDSKSSINMETSAFSKLRPKDSHITTEDVLESKRFILAESCLHPFQGLATERGQQDQNRATDGRLARSSVTLWIGLSMKVCGDHIVEVGMVCHNGTNSVDFAVYALHIRVDGHDQRNPCLSSYAERRAQALSAFFIDTLREVARANACKFIGAGIASEIIQWSPQLPARLWIELDILPIALDMGESKMDVSESADSMARKCIMYFGPDGQPGLHIGPLGNVEVGLAGRAIFPLPEQCEGTVRERSARMAMAYAHSLRRKHTRLAFFSASAVPQGDDVARMRRALCRALECLEVQCSWFVPTPQPEAARTNKQNRRILRGVLEGQDLSTVDQRDAVDLWRVANAERWSRDGGPLASRARGGADVIVVDGFQMPALVSFAKKVDPCRSVIFRFHDPVRNDLISLPDSSATQIWGWIWSHIRCSDLFIASPIRSFLPQVLPKERTAFMPVTIDWLDGVNKHLTDDAIKFYHDRFNGLCLRENTPLLAYPERDYILQIAALDSYTGVEHALAAYAAFRRRSRYCSTLASGQTPQLVLCGYSSMGDLYSGQILGRIRSCLKEDYAELADSVIIVSLGLCDQTLNALLSRARVMLQMSLGDVYEVTVSEALHKGVPVIARNSGGNALQIRHAKTGFLVQGLDKQSEIRAIAEHLDFLLSDQEGYYEMSSCGRTQISDEVGTVGNAVCWLYLADRLTSAYKLRPNERWVWDMAKEHAGERLPADQVELPRDVTV